MRLLLLASALLLTTLAVVPAANAAHVGPCTHEFGEIVIYVATTKDVRNGVTYTGYCANSYVWWACDTIRCDRILA